MTSEYDSVVITMKQAEMAAFMVFAKNVSVTAVRRTARNSKEFVLMQEAIDRLLQALRDAGYSFAGPAPDPSSAEPCRGTVQSPVLLDFITRPDNKSWS
jgi:hypothetical protein